MTRSLLYRLLTLCAVALPAGATGDVCDRIAAKLASVSTAECRERNLQRSSGRSVRGTPILARSYPPLEQRRPLGRVLLVGGIHGDEYAAASIVFKWMSILDHHHAGLFHWRIVPLLNPDGLLQPQSQRVNANGVDLDRNLPTADWNSQAGAYWIRETERDPRRYPGAAALSEPETQWLVEEIERFQPDAIVAVHAPYRLADYTGSASRLGRLQQPQPNTYPGSLAAYAGMELNIPVLNIELPYADTMPESAAINGMWVDLIDWLRQNLHDEDMATGND